MPHASVPTSNVAIRRPGRVVTQHKIAQLELAMRELARATLFGAQTAHVENNLAIVHVLESGATVAILTASAELVHPSVARTNASPATVRGRICRRPALQVGVLETRPTEPVEAQVV
ncbi:hypothetical protein ACEPPN_005678 [Leptodophora sp. 'Broadleaf-Isolate-01']